MEPTSVLRKLTAILSADVKGYSRLMAEDEVATIRTLKAYRELMASLIQQHRGRVVDTVGDNLLADFGSVVDAVSCAVEIQRQLTERNAELPDHRRMEFRIGINLGDVIVDGERIYGDGVNIAARVEGLAEGGGVCISGTVHEQVKNKLAVGYEFLGDHTVKNITEPVRVYQVLLVPRAGTDQAAHSTQAVRSILAGTEATTIGSHPLVGRERELSSLQQKLDTALEGKGSVVFITGQAGIGKTRLAREIRHLAEQRGCQWLEGKYERSEQPYRAWASVVRAYLPRRKTTSLSSLAGPYAAQLAKIVPELAGGLASTAASVSGDPESERFFLFEGITQFLIRASEEDPLVLFLDDLQWASSIDLLHHLSQKIGNQRILVLGAYRDDELKQTPPLQRTLLAMNRQRLFHPLPVEALKQTEVAQLVSQRVNGATDAQLVGLIYNKTEGNPFFAEELLRLLQERKAIDRTEAGWRLKDLESVEIPESVKAVITEHLERLGEDAVELLQIASVIGRQFPLRLLRELVDKKEEAVVKVLDRCETAGLVVSHQARGEEIYNFTHDLLQETLYESIGPAQRRRHHLRIGQAVEKLYSTRLEERYDALANHFFEGNNLGKVVDYGGLAAERAFRVHAYGKAVQLLEQVLEAQAVINPNDRVKRCDLLLALGSALGPAGEPKRVADAVAPEALGIAEKLDDRRRASECCQMALEGLHRFGSAAITRSPTWRQWAERASHYAAPGTSQQVIADRALSLVHLAQRQWSEYRILTVRAVELARKLDEPEVLSQAILGLLVAQGVRHHAEQLSLVEEFMGIRKEGVSASIVNRLLHRSQEIFLAAGKRARAEEVWRELDQLVSHTHDAETLIWPLLAGLFRAKLDGELEHVVEARARIINRADEVGISGAGRLMAEHLSFRPLLYLGRGEEALAALPEAERLVGSQTFSSTVRFGWSALCLAHMGRLAEAQSQFSEYLGQLNLSPEEDDTPTVILATLLETAVVVEDREAASMLAKRLTGIVASALSNSLHLVPVARHLGGAAVLLGDRTAARANYDRALDWATKIRFRPEVALTRFELAKLLLSEAEAATGSPSAAALRSEAQAHLDFAIGEFRAMKMQPALEQALRQKDLLTV